MKNGFPLLMQPQVLCPKISRRHLHKFEQIIRVKILTFSTIIKFSACRVAEIVNERRVYEINLCDLEILDNPRAYHKTWFQQGNHRLIENYKALRFL